MYRVTAGLTGLPANVLGYGELLIYGLGYYIHMYTTTAGDVFIGTTADSIVIPTNWVQIFNNKTSKFVQLFSGSIASGTGFTLQTKQSAVGAYRGLIVTLFNSSVNNTVYAYIPQYMLVGNTNLYSPVQFDTSHGYIHSVPYTDITDIAMKFDWNNTAYTLVRIVAEL